MTDIKTGLWQNNLDGSYIKIRTIKGVDILYSDEGCRAVHKMSVIDLLSSYQLHEADKPAPVVIDDTFNDDTPAQTFGELITCASCQTSYGDYSEQQKIDSENGGACLFCQQKNEFLQRKNKKMRLIGIAGQARSGKDTLASYMLDNLDGTWLRSSFADPLKAMLSVIGVDCSDDAKAVIDDTYGATPRHMMQTLGTEWGRHMINGDIWVKAFARLNAGKCVIVPDVRFENEADLVREHGVLIHLVGRGGIEGSHVSETPIAFKPGDIVIDNSRDMAWLHGQVDGNAVLGEFVSAE
jgi:hypothetical protein